MQFPTIPPFQSWPVLIAILLLGSLLSACSSGEAEPETLTRHDGVSQQQPEMPGENESAPKKTEKPATPPEPPIAQAATPTPTEQARTQAPQSASSPGLQAAPPANGPGDPRAQHGANPTLRSSTRLDPGAKKNYPLVKPDWSKPYPMTFRKLMLNYQYVQVHGSFFEKGLPRIHGGAVEISGAVMPIDAPGEDGKLSRFWLANPLVVMAGCVFCNPPTLGDLVYVEAKPALEVDREALYQSVVTARLIGRLFIDGGRTSDGVEYLYHMQLKQVME
jgi:hypothetical protein